MTFPFLDRRRHGSLMAATSAGAFDPTQLTNLIAYYDPLDLSTLFSDRAGTIPAVVDGPVGVMRDKGQSANHAVAPADINRPILRNPSGNLYELDYNGTSSYFALTYAIPIQTDMMISRAFKRASAGIRSHGICFATGSVPHAGRWITDDTSSVALGSGSGGPTSTSTQIGGFVDTAIRDSTIQSLRRNGSIIQSIAATSVGGNLNAIGLVNSSAYNSGRMSRIIIAGAATASEVTNSERWNADSVGISF